MQQQQPPPLEYQVPSPSGRGDWRMTIAQRIGWICAFAGAVAVAGFIAGFVGPIVHHPASNQGPLLGIFITGPLGAVLGVLLGIILSLVTTKASRLVTLLVIVSLLYGGGWWLYIALTPDPGGQPSHVVEDEAEIKQLAESTVSVRARGLSDSDIKKLARLRQLRTLDFSSGHAVEDAKITDRGLAELSTLDLPHLETLTLGYSGSITDAGMAHVARMRTVRWLSLMVCPKITDAGLPPLLSMENLTGLDLRGCTGITDKGLEHLKGKKNWETIMLGGCPNVTPEAVGRLQKALPTADVKKDDVEWSHHQ